MAQLALLLCLSFVIFAFRQDIKEYHKTSGSLWIPLIWLIASASRPLTLWLNPYLAQADTSDFDFSQGNSTERMFLSLLLCAGLMILYRRRKRFAFNFRDNLPLAILYFYAFISIAWSDYQGPSLKRWIRAVGDVIMVIIILTEDNKVEAIERILRRCAILLVPLSFLFVRFYSYYGITYTRDGQRMWTGVTTNKNTLGMLCAFMGIFLVWRILRALPHIRKASIYVDLVVLGLALYLLRGSQSATSQVVFIMGTLILVLSAIARGNSTKLARIIISILLLLAIVQGILWAFFDSSIDSIIFSTTERDTSFTGRTILWEELFQIGSKNFMFGSGFGSFWLGGMPERVERLVGFRVIQAHNGYIEVFLQLGIVGVISLFVLIANALKTNFKFTESNSGLASLHLAFLSMIIFHNYTEATLAAGTSLLWFLFLLSSILIISKPIAAGVRIEK